MNWRRREFLTTTLGAGAAFGQAPSPRPNVLIFLSDQESQLTERSILKLPNRERLERLGAQFSQCYCTTPQCSPARAALWTGRYPHRTGVVANVGAVGAYPLSPEIPSIGETFRQAGYRTGYFGKWHLTAGRSGGPSAFGFEKSSDGRDDREICEAAAAWIQDQADHPWFAVVSIIQPHDIYDYPRQAAEAEASGKKMPIRERIPPPPSGRADLRGRPLPQRLYTEQDQGQACVNYDAEEWRRYRSLYYDLIEDADRNLGIVSDAVAAARGDDTITVYTSDHGDGQGAHGLAFKGPFMYEELLRIPLVISWPRRFERPAKSDALTSQIDIFPTICDLAGVEAPAGIDGKSLKAALEGSPATEPEEVFSEYHSKQRWANPIRNLRRGQWKYNVYLDGGRELYHLADDPSELRNLAGQAQARPVEKELFARLEKWAGETTDSLWFEKRPAAPDQSSTGN